jgi:hypothetical protein
MPTTMVNANDPGAGCAVADRPLLNANGQALAVPSPDRPLLNANGQALAVPAPIGSNGSSFTVTRTSQPATTGREPAVSRPAQHPVGR